MKIAAFTKDLMVSSRIAGSAGGNEVVFARSLEILSQAVADGSISLVIFDLADKESETAFKLVKTTLPDAVCIGYYPHVKKETADKFKKLGCDKVVPRSRFARELPELIKLRG